MKVQKGVDGQPLYDTEKLITVRGQDKDGNPVEITFTRIVGMVEIPKEAFLKAVRKGEFTANAGMITAGNIFSSGISYRRNDKISQLMPKYRGKCYDALVFLAVVEVEAIDEQLPRKEEGDAMKELVLLWGDGNDVPTLEWVGIPKDCPLELDEFHYWQSFEETGDFDYYGHGRDCNCGGRFCSN